MGRVWKENSGRLIAQVIGVNHKYSGVVFDFFWRNGPDCKIELKNFHAQIQNDVEKLKLEDSNYTDIPVIRKLSTQLIQDNYLQVKLDVQLMIEREMENLRSLKKKQSGLS